MGCRAGRAPRGPAARFAAPPSQSGSATERPVAALRESIVDARGMPLLRWVCGLATLAGALYVLWSPVFVEPAAALKRKGYVPGVMLLEQVLAAIGAEAAPGALRLPRVKFMQPLLPGETADIELEPVAPPEGTDARRWRFRVRRGDALLASGEVASA
mgnify:CR=1 FL=1